MNSALKNMNDKPILAIETSGSLCGAAVFFSGNKFYEAKIEYKNIHAEKIFDIIDYVLKSAEVKPEDLYAVAVSSGPGSFTGLRIGMSAAKGFAFGAALPIIPVPTFEALALQLSLILPEGTNFVIANKINMEEVYFARFHVKSNNFIFGEDLQIVHSNKLDEKIAGDLVFGNAVKSNKPGAEENKISVPNPEYVARWAMMNRDKLIFDFDYLEPNYIKNFIIKEKRYD